jgi:hypothetical protein
LAQVSDMFGCAAPGCRGVPETLSEAVSAPSYWVRTRPSGGWWCTTISPIAPKERAGGQAWRCPVCRATFCAVDVARESRA